jgi:hypothetical protein
VAEPGRGRPWPVRTWLWLAFLGLVCLAETVTHTGARNPFLESSRPVYARLSGNDFLPADGYVSWIGHVPVLQDAESFVKQTALFLGQQGPQDSGFLDRRAAYSYFASLLVPWFRWDGGAYAAFVAVNVLFWWATAATMYWLVRRRTGDTAVALAASFLVAAGNGLVFMVGMPQSYLPAYASLVLIPALAEWLNAWHRPHRLGPWLLLGWAAGVAATVYFTHISLTVFWWVYGLRRVPWRYLLAATALAFGIGTLWELWGQQLVGLRFLTDNSSLVGAATDSWRKRLLTSWPGLVTGLRDLDSSGTVLGAIPPVWWLLAAVGLAVSRKDDREWALAGIVAGLVPTLAMLTLLPLPRIAYFMYPAVYFLAAQGIVWLARACARLLAGASLPAPVARLSAVAVAVGALAGLALLGNADTFGYALGNAQFHYGLKLGR